jgi:nitrogen regulatory protein PII
MIGDGRIFVTHIDKVGKNVSFGARSKNGHTR